MRERDENGDTYSEEEEIYRQVGRTRSIRSPEEQRRTERAQAKLISPSGAGNRNGNNERKENSSKESPRNEIPKKSPKILWESIQTILRRLVELGFDRTLIFSVLPYVERKIMDKSLQYCYHRFQKRVSESWRVDEPTEVVQLCHRFLHTYDELQQILRAENCCGVYSE